MVAWAEDHADFDDVKRFKPKRPCWGFARIRRRGWSSTPRLRKRPPGLGVDAWKRYTHNVLSRMSPAAIRRLIKLTETQMIHVAKASAGAWASERSRTRNVR